MAALVAVVIGLTGCGGGGDDPVATTTQTTLDVSEIVIGAMGQLTPEERRDVCRRFTRGDEQLVEDLLALERRQRAQAHVEDRVRLAFGELEAGHQL
ncbi:MAG TPA: hypothetical protein VIX41_08940, partial [Acidimicrobiales bacterium]